MASGAMVRCCRCGRHLFLGGTTCPFCGALALGASCALIAAEGLTAAGCKSCNSDGPSPSATKASSDEDAANPVVSSVYGPPPPVVVTNSDAGPWASGASKTTGVTVTSGNVPNAEQTVAGMQPGFNACYRIALRHAPNVTGQVKVTIDVGQGGKPTQARAALQPNSVLPPDLLRCVEQRARSARFDPGSGTAQVEFIVEFARP